MDLIAKKGLRYGGRVLAPGDEFSANRRDGRILVAIGKAARSSGRLPCGGVDRNEPASNPDDEIETLRAAYSEKHGREADKRWGPDRLKKEIAD